MKPILICIHLFYLDQWPQMQAAINNMTHYAHELYITLPHSHAEFEPTIHAALPQAHVIYVENKGYDIAPFITVLNQVNLSDFSYVVKLHTKRNCNFSTLVSNEWRQALMQFAQTKAGFDQHIAYLETHPEAGMLTHYKTKLPARYDPDDVAQQSLEHFISQQQWPKLDYSFVAGTMFIVRAPLLQPLKALKLTAESFDESNNHKSGFAHMIERLLGYLVYLQGYQVQDITPPHSLANRFHQLCLRWPHL